MIKELLPPSLAQDENIKALSQALDTQLQKIENQIINVLILPRIDQISNPELLDLLAWQFHIEGYELAQTVEEKRNLIKSAIELHRYKGTKYAIKKVLEALGLEGQVKEWFEYNGQPYRFRVELGVTNRQITPELRNKLVKLIEDYKNERSWLEEIVLYYLARGNGYICAGNMAETEAVAHQIDGFEWTAIGTPQIYTGSMGEAEAWAQ